MIGYTVQGLAGVAVCAKEDLQLGQDTKMESAECVVCHYPWDICWSELEICPNID